MNNNIFERTYLNLILEENKFEEKIVKNIEIKGKNDEFANFLNSIHIDNIIQENKGKSLKNALKDIGSKLKGIKGAASTNSNSSQQKTATDKSSGTNQNDVSISVTV